MSRAMREKYGRGIVSEAFIDSGYPQHFKLRMNEYRKEQKKMAAFDKKLTGKAERSAAAEFRKKNKKGKEYRIVFA